MNSQQNASPIKLAKEVRHINALFVAITRSYLFFVQMGTTLALTIQLCFQCNCYASNSSKVLYIILHLFHLTTGALEIGSRPEPTKEPNNVSGSRGLTKRMSVSSISVGSSSITPVETAFLPAAGEPCPTDNINKAFDPQ